MPPVSSDDPGFEDDLVERIVFAQLGGESVDIDAELADLPRELADSIRRRVAMVSDLRRMAAAAREHRDDDVPQRLGEFELEGEIARGGMGIVYRAYQPALRRHVAIKVLPRLAAADERRVERFVREADSLGRLQHPGIVPVLSAGEAHGVLFFAMPIVEGVPLSQVLDAYEGVPAHQRSMRVVVELMESAAPDHSVDLPDSYVEFITRTVAQAAAALAYAHEQGVLHRDIKPANLMCTPHGQVRIIDFGLVRLVDAETRLTRSEEVVGTAAYLSPEEVDSSPLVAATTPDGRSDVYSLGVVLYEALAGVWPFSGERVSGVLERIRSSTPEPLGRMHRGIPRDLETICHKAIERDPARRYAGAAEFAQDLDRFLRFEPIQATPPGAATRALRALRRRPKALVVLALLAVSTVFVVALVGVGAFLARIDRDVECEEYVVWAASVTDELETLCAESRSVTRRRDELEALVQSRHIDAAERTALVESRDAVDSVRKEFRSLAILASSREERITSIAREVDTELAERVREAVLGVLAVEWRDAVERGDEGGVERCIERLARMDEHGEHAHRLVARGSLTVARPADGSGAGYLFRCEPLRSVVADAPTARWIPVPCRAAGDVVFREFGGVRPGALCLEVLERDPRTGLEPGDLIWELDGRAVQPGFYVRSVATGGVADAAGIRPWDYIVSVDDSPIESWADLRAAVYFGGAELRLRVARPGRTLNCIVPSDVPRRTVFSRAAGLEFGTAVELLRDASVPDRAIEIAFGRGDELRRSTIPAGESRELVTVDTTAPLCRAEICRIQRFDVPIELPVGEYVVCFRSGDRDVRYPVSLRLGDTVRIDPEPRPVDAPTDAAVWIPRGVLDRPVDPRAPGALVRDRVTVPGFFIDRFETSLAQWFEFVEDPSVQAEIQTARESGGALPCVPRYEDDRTPRTLAQPMSLKSPARWVTFADVLRFIEWRNVQLESVGSRWRAGLPSAVQWERAAGSSARRVFPWGDRFEPGLTMFQYTWPVPFRMPCGAMRGDESVYGVRDLGGSVCEWLREAWDGTSGRFQATAGASWAYTWRDAFRTQSRSAESRVLVNEITGVRLVYEVVE